MVEIEDMLYVNATFISSSQIWISFTAMIDRVGNNSNYEEANEFSR